MFELIPIEKLKPNPFNERKTTEKQPIEDLASNMRQNGFHGALMGRRSGEFVELAYGSRRLRAAKIAGIKEIPVQIREISDKDMAFIASSENLLRQDVDVKERAKHFYDIAEKFGLSAAEITRRTGAEKGMVEESLYYIRNGLNKIEPRLSLGAAVRAHRIGGEPLVHTAQKFRIGEASLASDYAIAIKRYPELKDDLIHGKILPESIRLGNLRAIAGGQISISQAFARALSRMADVQEIIRFLEKNWENEEITDSERALLLQRYSAMRKVLPSFEAKVEGELKLLK